MYHTQTEGCCGVVELIGMSNLVSIKQFEKEFKQLIEDANYLNMWDKEYQTPRCWIATTESKKQTQAEKILAKYGFACHEFTGIYADKGKNYLKFWIKFGELK